MDRLAELREKRALTLRELSEMSGVAADTINQIELGHRRPRPSTLRKLARALEVDVREFFEEPALAGKAEAPRDTGLRDKDPETQEPPPDFEVEQRGSKLPETADLLLKFGEMLLLTWEAELPDRARADDEWLANIIVLWRMFGLINYGVLDELGVDGVRDKEAWLARYMDINATVHRINATIREHSTAGASPDEEAAEMLQPLAVA